MVEAEKAIAAFSIQKAIEKAQNKGHIKPPIHVKSFINSFEEASKETNQTLNEMWINILANQLIDSEFHPRYVNILSSFSAEEANLLLKINPINELGENISGYIGSPREGFDHYILKCNDKILNKWNYSCNILLEFGLAEVISSTENIYKNNNTVTILYKTLAGDRFLRVVTTN